MIALLTVIACGPPVDPLAELRLAYATAQQGDPTTQPPHAQVRVGGEAIGRLVQEVLDRPLTAPGPFGMRLVITPTVTRSDVHLDGDGPIWLAADLAGTADLTFPLMTADDLSWQARLSGEVVATTSRRPDGAAIGLVWRDPAAVVVDVRLPGAPDAVSNVVRGMVEGAVRDALAEARTLELPAAPWAEIRDARPRGVAGDLVVDVVASGVVGAPPPPLGPPGDGWAAAASAGSLLGTAQALSLGQRWDDTVVVEPRGVILRDGAVEVAMRVHARSRRPKFRDYRLVSTVGIGAAGLEIPVDTLELVGHERWRGGLRVQIGEQRAVKLLRDGLADVPLTVVAALPVDRSLHLEVRAIELSTDVLTLSGAVEVK